MSNNATSSLSAALRSLPSPSAHALARSLVRRHLAMVTKAWRAAPLFLILIILLCLVLLSTWLALSLSGALGAVGTITYGIAAPSLIPALMPRQQPRVSRQLRDVLRNTALIVGPTLCGVVLSWTGISIVSVLVIGPSGLAVLLLSGRAEVIRVVQATRNLIPQLRQGAALVAAHHILRPILITRMFFNLSWFIVQGVFVTYAVHQLGLTAAEVDATFGSYMGGMLVGALAIPWLAKRIPLGAMVAIGPAGGLAAAITVVTTILYPSAVLTGLGFFLFGSGPIVWTITTTTLGRAVTPSPVRGCVSTAIMTATYGMQLIGTALGGLVAAHFGADFCLVLALGGFLVQFLVIIGSPVIHLSRPPLGT